jgi:hypothetical protein
MKDKFPDVPQFEEHAYKNDSMIVRMLSHFRYVSSRGTVIVPRGFLSDGASVPRLFWGIFSPFGNPFRAALIHDFLYSKDSDEIFPCDRLTADLIFKEAMYNLGIGWVKRETIYRAVRFGGGRSFKKKFSHD